MIAEGGGRTDRLAVDPAAPAGRAVFISRRIDAGAQLSPAPAAPSTSAETAQEPSP